MGPGPVSVLVCLIGTVMLVAMPENTSQPKIGGEPGERVAGVEELEQSLRIVMGTPLNSIPGRPLFGNSLHDYIDQPIDLARANCVREIIRVFAAHLPRHILVGIVTRAPDIGVLENEITWKPAAGGAAQSTMVRTS